MPIAPNNVLDRTRLDPALFEDGSDIFSDAAGGSIFRKPVCNDRSEVVKILAYTQVQKYFAAEDGCLMRNVSRVVFCSADYPPP